VGVEVGGRLVGQVAEHVVHAAADGNDPLGEASGPSPSAGVMAPDPAPVTIAPWPPKS
jgi:hypothetical protein